VNVFRNGFATRKKKVIIMGRKLLLCGASVLAILVAAGAADADGLPRGGDSSLDRCAA
jgi:hypothetical protein